MFKLNNDDARKLIKPRDKLPKWFIVTMDVLIFIVIASVTVAWNEYLRSNYLGLIVWGIAFTVAIGAILYIATYNVRAERAQAIFDIAFFYEADIGGLEDEIEKLKNEKPVNTNVQIIENNKEYKEELKRLYTIDSNVDSTPDFAILCFKYKKFSAFNPIRYQAEIDYKTVINANSEDYITLIKKDIKESFIDKPTTSFESIEEDIESKLKQLKTNKRKNNSNEGFYLRERTRTDRAIQRNNNNDTEVR